MRNGHTDIVLILHGEWSNADRFGALINVHSLCIVHFTLHYNALFYFILYMCGCSVCNTFFSLADHLIYFKLSFCRFKSFS